MRLIANKRSVATILIAIALLGVIASTQTWVSYSLDPATSIVPQLDVSGVDAQPLAFALFLAAGAAIFAALLVTGWLRAALFAGTALLGGLAALVSAQILGTRTSAGRARLTEVLGLSDTQSLDAALLGVTFTAWIFVTVALGILLTVMAVIAMITAKSWQASGRRYTRAGTQGARASRTSNVTDHGVEPQGNRIEEWDALTEGSDPTS